MTAMNLKIDQLVEKSMVGGVEKSMVIGGSTKVNSVIATKPRMGFAPGTMHTQTNFSKLNFSTFNEENPTIWVY